MPVIRTLGNPGFRDRHWENVSNIVGFPVKGGSNLFQILDMGLDEYVSKFEKIRYQEFYLNLCLFIVIFKMSINIFMSFQTKGLHFDPFKSIFIYFLYKAMQQLKNLIQKNQWKRWWKNGVIWNLQSTFTVIFLSFQGTVSF